jgi:Uma2 family endonuclease
MESLTATLEPELMTEDETMPEVEPEGLYEVVNGRVVEKPLMGAYQAWVATELFKLIIESRIHLEGRFAAELLFWLDRKANLKRRPDLAFVSYERWPKKRPIPDGTWDVVPDLAIEVISPTNLATEVIAKLGEYFRAGVQRVWVIYPRDAQIYVYDSPTVVRILTRADRLVDKSILPGLSLPLSDLFESGDQAAE